ncbi:MAG: hypothetical protein PHC61_11295, partial [Chitinivibrionales bacterium]|nr:hypothetical protein [Chitinivibrionales bacterium]
MKKTTGIFAGLLCLSIFIVSANAQWTNISSKLLKAAPFQDTTVGVGGVCVNRLTGDIIIDVNDNGLFKSSDQGNTYTQVAKGIVSGQRMNAWSFQ